MSGLKAKAVDEEPYSWLNERFVDSVVKGPDWTQVHSQAEKLTPKDWQKILLEPLDVFKQQLPRLTSFIEIKALINWSMGPIGSLETPPEILVKPEKIGLGTRCLDMKVGSLNEEKNASNNLLLTSQGIWLLWQSSYKTRKSGPLKKTNVRTATRSEFTIIPEESVISTMAEATGQSAWKVVGHLFRGMAQHIAQARQNKLEDIRHLEYVAGRVFNVSDDRLGLGNKSLFFSDLP